jgi:pyruvate/2-oxoglutarate dehydrogenase complex dihydrolipoamide dehydrogenase (E3) component
MRLVTQPESILIIGGGYIGAEMAQVIYIHPALTEVVG